MTVSVSEEPAAIVAGSVAPETVKALLPVEIAEIVALALPVLLITTVCVLVVPAVMPPKESDEALACSVAVGAAFPVPLRLTVCDPPEALSVTVIVPVRLPVAVGEKATLIVQVAAAARLAGQLLLSEKLPLAAMPLIVSAVVPLFVSVIAWVELVVPTVWPAKVRLVGDKLATGVPAAMVIDN